MSDFSSSERKNSDLEINVLKLIREFNLIKNVEDAVPLIVSKICSLFLFERACLFLKNTMTSEFFKVFECNAKGNVNHFSSNSVGDLDKLSRFFPNVLNDFEREFIKIFEEENCVYTDDFKKIENVMKGVSFDFSSEIENFYVFNMRKVDSLGYLAFENNENDISKSDLEILTTLCELISTKVENFEVENTLQNDIKLQKFVMTCEDIFVYVVRKKDLCLLYANDLFFEKAENKLKLGDRCDFLLDAKLCHLEHMNSLMQFELNGKSWIERNYEMVLYDDVPVYIIYGKEETDNNQPTNIHDPLTKTIKYRYFTKQYEELIRRSDDSANFALCTIDINNFMHINNILGYDSGNEILISIAAEIGKFVADDEFFSRINDDKFVMLIKYDEDKELKARIATLKGVFDELQKNSFKGLAISGGVTIVDKNKELVSLIDETNVARRSVKGSLLNKIKCYDDTLKGVVEKEKLVEEKMFLAIKNDEYVPYFQAKFDIQTNELCGAEVLVRWEMGDEKMYPDDFIPIFEKNGFITTLDFIVYEKTFKYMREYLDKGVDLCEISLNVSRGHINTNDFVEKFLKLVYKYQIPIELIELEVTESLFIGDKSLLTNFVDGLKAEKFKVSIDDFGTAYSTLNVLKDIDADVLKIDKDFLHGINFVKVTDVPTKDKVVISHIVSVAKDLNFNVICEGVETQEQLDFLKEIGCELGQGYLFAKPMPVKDFMKRFYDC